jgi:hypothetical protein
MNTVCLDRFFTRQNVALYRMLADKKDECRQTEANLSVAGGGASQVQVGFREACGARKSALTCRHGENAAGCVAKD